VVDCGIGVYQEQPPPPGIAVGDMVRGIANLGVDPFSYFERLHAFAGMPPLIYTWRIDERSPDRRPRSLKRATCSFEILRSSGGCPWSALTLGTMTMG
jgi:hypothetical protein